MSFREAVDQSGLDGGSEALISDPTEGRNKFGLETSQRPRADQVMKDLELQMDLSEDVSQSNTITDD